MFYSLLSRVVYCSLTLTDSLSFQTDFLHQNQSLDEEYQIMPTLVSLDHIGTEHVELTLPRRHTFGIYHQYAYLS